MNLRNGKWLWQRDDCARFQERWSAAFDAREALSGEEAGHSENCARCRKVMQTAELARTRLRSVPLPPPNPSADAQLLGVLLAEQVERPERSQTWRLMLHRRLGLVGLASFGATLLVAGVLAMAPLPTPIPAGPGLHTGTATSHGARLQYRFDLPSEASSLAALGPHGLRGWIGRPASESAPSPALPAHVPHRPERRGAAFAHLSVG